MIESISVIELKKLVNVNLIDIRNIEKFNSNHIPGAINIPMNQFLISFNKRLNKENKYYIYCQKGIQSRKIVEMLKNNGFNAVNVTGGYEAWILN